MEMDKKLQDAVNEQIAREFYSAYLYLAMAAYFDSVDLPGFSRWMKAQAKEEVSHGMKFYEYLADRGARVTLKAIAQPPAEFSSPLDVFEKTLAHEQEVTRSIDGLYALAAKAGDNASVLAFQWFVTEQVEEEKNASDIIAKLRRVGEKGHGLILMDKELGSRE